MKADEPYLRHILDEVVNIRAFTVEGHDAFMTDRKTQHAVVRSLEVIGEATKRLSETLRSWNPDVPWRSIAGMRDRSIHDYFGVDLDIVWQVVVKDLGPLEQRARKLLNEPPT